MEGPQQVDEGTLLRGHLSVHDAECPVCGYNLRGLQGSLCPECASRIELSVRSPDLHQKWYLTSLISMAIALGGTGLVSAIYLYFALAIGFPPGNEATAVYVMWFLAAVSSILVLGLIALRRRFFRLTMTSQRAAALLSVLLSLGANGAFIALVLFFN